jgi:hypothetical protein
MSTLADLEEKYSQEMTEKERSELEVQIWALVPFSERELLKSKGLKPSLVSYIYYRFNSGRRSIRVRQYLNRTGSAADPVWERVQKDMTLNSALEVIHKARTISSNDSIEMKDAVIRCLSEYDSSGDYKVVLANGKVTQRKRPSSFRNKSSASPGKTFWNSLREQIGNYVESRLKDSDHVVRDQLIRRFEADLHLLIEDFQWALNKAPKTGLESIVVTISRKSIISACNTLGMDPPRPGKPVDMKLAVLQKRRHARMYHPDVHGGSHDTANQFKASMEAFKILEKYNENFTCSNVKTGSTDTNTERE